MTTSLFASSGYRKTLRRLAASFLMLSINLTGGVGALFLTTEVAYAATVLPLESFGDGASQNDVSNWDEAGDDTTDTTLAKSPTANTNESMSPNGGRFVRIAQNEWICRTVDASTREGLKLGYYWRGDIQAEGKGTDQDDGIIEYKEGGACDDAGGWSQLQNHDLSNSSSWTTQNAFNLPNTLDDSIFSLRFRADSTAADEYFRVDGITITDSSNYVIAVTSQSLSGLTFTIGGTGDGAPYVGQLSSHGVQVNWGDTVVDNNSTVNFVDPAGNPKDFTGTWSNSHLYASAGTYTVTAKLYHQNAPGAEGSGDATFSFLITIPSPQDTVPPDIASHVDITAHATSTSGAVVTYTPPTTSDNVDPAGSASCTPASGSTFPIGVTTVNCNAVDSSQNSATPTTFKVTVVNDTPAITLNGLNPLDLILGINTYTEPGAVANDTEDGTVVVSAITGFVNSLVLGTYSIFYNHTDTAGTTAAQVIRTVNVIPGSTQCSDGVSNDHDSAVDMADPGCTNLADNNENQPPVISVTGSNPLELVVNVGSYTEEGATAVDAEDGTGLIVTSINSSAINPSIVGTYSVRYNYTDTDGGMATEVLRTVNVVYGQNECNDGKDNDGDTNADMNDTGCSIVGDVSENTPPTVVVDIEMLMLALHSVFTPPTGVHATDPEDGTVTVIVESNPVDADTIGDYTVTYGATDAHGAGAEPKTQTVKVRAACGDGVDNDRDQLIDETDPGCDGATDDDETDPAVAEDTPTLCTDGIDNDQDNFTDGADSDCTPSLTVIKHVVNDNGGTKEASEFNLHVNIPDQYTLLDAIGNWLSPKIAYAVSVLYAPTSFIGNESGTMVNFEGASDYTVTEDADPLYVTTMSSDCSGHIALGEHKTCIVTNDDIQQGGGGGGGGGGSTTFDHWGCTNPSATNYNSLSNRDDGSCNVPGGSAPTITPAGEVLGAATTEPELPLPAGCSAYITTYMKLGKKTNDVEDVKRLQTFLNETMTANLPVSGYFGSLTKKWVKKFQARNYEAILKPWQDVGYTDKNLKEGTGVVYKTTKRAINLMKCASLNEPMPNLTNDQGL